MLMMSGIHLSSSPMNIVSHHRSSPIYHHHLSSPVAVTSRHPSSPLSSLPITTIFWSLPLKNTSVHAFIAF